MRADRSIGAVAILVGLVLLLAVIPMQTSDVTDGVTAPATFPSIGALMIVLAGLWQMLQPTGATAFAMRELGGVAVVAGIAIAGFLLMIKVGYLAAAPVMVAAAMLYRGERRWPWIAVGGIVFPLLIWALFALVLERVLP